jgi:hypothetical protein
MAAPTNTPMTGEIWHLTIDDLLAPLPEVTRLGGPGPFVINLSASTAPITVPAKSIAGCEQAHMYQLQRTEDRRPRYRLRLGPFGSEDEADAVLMIVRDIYPGALTATADDDDLRAIATLRAKTGALPPASEKPAAPAVSPRPAAKPLVSAAATAVTVPTLSDTPVSPSKPMPSAIPTLFATPAAPATPAARAKPMASTIPTHTAAPASPAKPMASPIPTLTAAPTGPAKPMASTVPTLTAAPTDPAKPMAPGIPTLTAAPASPAKPMAPAVLTLSASPGVPATPAAPAIPAVSTAPTPAKPMAPAVPAVSAAPIATATPMAPARPTAEQRVPVRMPAAGPTLNAPVPRQAEESGKRVPSLDATQTVRALTELELEDADAARWFVIQLSLAEEAFDPDTLPNLDIFSVYRLYSVAGIDQGRIMHALRLGFFTEEISAGAVASYLATFYDKPTIKRVSSAERERFAEQCFEPRKDVGATGKHAAIEITSERFVRERRTGAAK